MVAQDHYCVPPLERVNLAEILELISDKRYFVLHAPRQTGKTSTLLALRNLLNSGVGGDFRCIYVNVEAAQAAREYGLGRGRTDLLVIRPRGGRATPGSTADKFVIECKVLHKSLEWTVRRGLEQTAAYMARCGSESGHLVIFDRSEGKWWDDKLFRRAESIDGRTVTVWGM